MAFTSLRMLYAAAAGGSESFVSGELFGFGGTDQISETKIDINPNNTNQCIIVYSKNGGWTGGSSGSIMAMAGTINGENVTLGTPVTIGNPGEWGSGNEVMFSLNGDYFIVFYCRYAGVYPASYLTARIGTISGNTISLPTTEKILNSSTTSANNMVTLRNHSAGNGHFMVGYRSNQNGPWQAFTKMISSYSNGSISGWSSPSPDNNDSDGWAHGKIVADLNTNKALTLWRSSASNNGTSDHGITVRVGHMTSTNVSWQNKGISYLGYGGVGTAICRPTGVGHKWGESLFAFCTYDNWGNGTHGPNQQGAGFYIQIRELHNTGSGHEYPHSNYTLDHSGWGAVKLPGMLSGHVNDYDAIGFCWHATDPNVLFVAYSTSVIRAAAEQPPKYNDVMIRRVTLPAFSVYNTQDPILGEENAVLRLNEGEDYFTKRTSLKALDSNRLLLVGSKNPYGTAGSQNGVSTIIDISKIIY